MPLSSTHSLNSTLDRLRG